jgi:hypothetical protein
MAAIKVSDDDLWIVARWALATLAERALEATEEGSDANALRQAMALDNLNFELLEPDQAARLAGIVGKAAASLRDELRTKDAGDPRDRELADVLDEIEASLRRAYG